MGQTKILVVEDDEDNRRILVLRLQQLGKFDISEATMGQEALDCITRDPPDVMFLNLQLPASQAGGVPPLSSSSGLPAAPPKKRS